METVLAVLCIGLLHAVGSIPSRKLSPRESAVNFLTNGATSTSETQFPYHVAVYEVIDASVGNSGFLCNGVIVDKDLVVTSASAVGINSSRELNVKDFSIIAGSNNIITGPFTSHTIKNYTLHENYSAVNYANDIIVFQVDPEFKISNTTQPIGISRDFTSDTSLLCIITSFVDPQGEDEVPEILKYASINIAACPENLKPSSLFCASVNVSADKGSPMACNSNLVGIATSSPNGYLTNVTKYYDWIFPPPTVNTTTAPEVTTTAPAIVTNTSNNFVILVVIICVSAIFVVISFVLVIKCVALLFYKST